MSVEIVFETHSLTLDNEQGIATGWLDGRLSPAGEHHAAELGSRRRDNGLAVVFASDLGRAEATARIAFDGTDLAVRLDPRLRECNYGKLNGKPVAHVDAQRRLRVDEPFPGGESYRDVAERVAAFLREVEAEWDDARILVIGHTATRWALDHLLDGTDLEELVGRSFDWRPGWTYVLE